MVLSSVLFEIYGNVLNSWLYGALVEMAYNGSPTTWTSNDWAFAPIDLSNISVPMIQKTGLNDSATRDRTSPNLGSTTNVTVDTPALRGRIECTPLNLSNTTNWLTTLDFSNRSGWDTIPPDIRSGYSLGASKDLRYGGYMSLNETGSGPYTTFFANYQSLRCCTNMTNGIPGRAAIGYWSPITSEMDTGDTQEMNFTIKWIVGKPLNQNAEISQTYGYPDVVYPRPSYFVWEEPPQMTALNCLPIFESSDAKVTVDLADNYIQKYTLNSKPVNAIEAWTDNWFLHNGTAPFLGDETYWSQNVTVS